MRNRKSLIAMMMKSSGAKDFGRKSTTRLMSSTQKQGSKAYPAIFTEAKEAYDSNEISPYKQLKFSSTQRMGTLPI